MTVEYAVGQQHIDVYAEREGNTVAVEVARSPEHQVANVTKCLEHRVDQVKVATLSEDIKDRIQTAVRAEFGQIPANVEFVPVSAFT